MKHILKCPCEGLQQSNVALLKIKIWRADPRWSRVDRESWADRVEDRPIGRQVRQAEITGGYEPEAQANRVQDEHNENTYSLAIALVPHWQIELTVKEWSEELWGM